jgi:putative FmdB family regulatory protein
MPTYEYKCPECGTEFEVFQKITAKPGAKCPGCGAKAERQLSAGAGLVFKGSGFYITDYKRAGEKKPDTAEKPAAKGETKSGGAEAPKPAKPETRPVRKKDD